MTPPGSEQSPPATVEDLHELAMALPGVTQGMSWGEMPSYLVVGKAFILHRSPAKDALDDETGLPLEDVILFRVTSPEDKAALVQGESPWFTTTHFDGYNTVLLRQAHVPQLTRDELAEVITDAWLARAPRRLAREWLDEHSPN